MSEFRKVQFSEKLLNHIKCGRNDEAKLVINKDHLREFDDFGNLLHYAVNNDNNEIAQYLINLGIALDAIGDRRRTPLVMAVMYGKNSLTKILLEAGASIDIADDAGMSALQIALLPWYIDMRIIHEAFYLRVKNDASTVNELIERFFKAGCSLKHAILWRDIEILEGLLQRGLAANESYSNGQKALHVATTLNDVESAKLLIDYGACVNILDSTGRGPLFYAARNRNILMMQLLLERNADPHPKTWSLDDMPLFQIISAKDIRTEESRIDYVELLLDYCNFSHNLPAFIHDLLNIEESPEKLKCLIAHQAMIEITSTQNIMNFDRKHPEAPLMEFKKYFDLCQQILKMVVYEKVSFFNLLTDSEYKMTLRVRNDTFMPVVQDFCLKNELNKLYPYYQLKLTKRISKADHRVKLEDKAVSVMYKISQKNYDQSYIITREICHYLNERDLEQLCQV